MTKQQVIDFLANHYTVTKEGENHAFHKGVEFIGAVKFKDDYPHILLDNEQNALKDLIALCCLDKPAIKFDKDELF